MVAPSTEEPSRMSDQMMKLADAYTRTGRNGNLYQVAYLANLKLLIFPVHDPQPDGPSHTLFVTPRPLRQNQRLSAPSPRSAGAAVLAGAGHGTEPLAVEPIPPGGDEVPW
jgi:hypothetical protein